jgi:hypothetical protein
VVSYSHSDCVTHTHSVVCHTTPIHKTIFNRTPIRSLYICSSPTITYPCLTLVTFQATGARCLKPVHQSQSAFLCFYRIRSSVWTRKSGFGCETAVEVRMYAFRQPALVSKLQAYRQINVVSSWWPGCSDINYIMGDLLLSCSKSETRNLWWKKKVYIYTKCYTFLYPDSCKRQTHCNWRSVYFWLSPHLKHFITLRSFNSVVPSYYESYIRNVWRPLCHNFSLWLLRLLALMPIWHYCFLKVAQLCHIYDC